VLRLGDQRRDVFPDRCVLSGVHTTGASRMTATVWRRRRWVLFVPGVVAVLAWVLRRPHIAVSIPVSPDVWTRWRRRVVLCQGGAAFGIVLIATGSAIGAAPPAAGVSGARLGPNSVTIGDDVTVMMRAYTERSPS
jgi:hypothetical protein